MRFRTSWWSIYRLAWGWDSRLSPFDPFCSETEDRFRHYLHPPWSSESHWMRRPPSSSCNSLNPWALALVLPCPRKWAGNLKFWVDGRSQYTLILTPSLPGFKFSRILWSATCRWEPFLIFPPRLSRRDTPSDGRRSKPETWSYPCFGSASPPLSPSSLRRTAPWLISRSWNDNPTYESRYFLFQLPGKLYIFQVHEVLLGDMRIEVLLIGGEGIQGGIVHLPFVVVVLHSLYSLRLEVIKL